MTNQTGAIEYTSFLSREEALANPHKLFVFGDNLARAGYGGQAKEMRGCLNAVGLPTKRRPAKDNTAYLTDQDFDEFKRELNGELAILEAHLEAGGTVVFPQAGVGTGLAELSVRSPKCWNYLCEQLTKLGINNGFTTAVIRPVKSIKIISGGQSGADQAGLAAAKDKGFPTGGLMPKDFKTEYGTDAALAEKYGLTEDSSSEYVPRTHKNAAAADVTLWFGNTDSPGYKCTANGCRNASKPIIACDKLSDLEIVKRIEGCKIINVAGNRESKNPGIYERTYKRLQTILWLLDDAVV